MHVVKMKAVMIKEKSCNVIHQYYQHTQTQWSMSSEARDARDDLDSFYSKMLELVDMVPAPKIQIKQDMNYGRFLANTLRGFRILLNAPQFYKI